MEEILQRAKWPILAADPVVLIGSTCIGMIKASMRHLVYRFSWFFGKEWINPGFAGLMTLRLESWNRLFLTLRS